MSDDNGRTEGENNMLIVRMEDKTVNDLAWEERTCQQNKCSREAEDSLPWKPMTAESSSSCSILLF